MVGLRFSSLLHKLSISMEHLWFKLGTKNCHIFSRFQQVKSNKIKINLPLFSHLFVMTQSLGIILSTVTILFMHDYQPNENCSCYPEFCVWFSIVGESLSARYPDPTMYQLNSFSNGLHLWLCCQGLAVSGIALTV